MIQDHQKRCLKLNNNLTKEGKRGANSGRAAIYRREVALISGHKDPGMLFPYTHLTAEELACKI